MSVMLFRRYVCVVKVAYTYCRILHEDGQFNTGSKISCIGCSNLSVFWIGYCIQKTLFYIAMFIFFREDRGFVVVVIVLFCTTHDI